uniref:Uncharacterized protein n=1 Tax=Lotharella oceanica TaxID=641309 RepID=A0A7S2XDF8_9EUKA|mmetsp:Transcript_29360/g.54971  ORF Transcript_29360/g.54971 Transcript_29360/m.54971 type:complete len:165 (+) Transcript_29360:307-801(+)
MLYDYSKFCSQNNLNLPFAHLPVPHYPLFFPQRRMAPSAWTYPSVPPAGHTHRMHRPLRSYNNTRFYGMGHCRQQCVGYHQQNKNTAAYNNDAHYHHHVSSGKASYSSTCRKTTAGETKARFIASSYGEQKRRSSSSSSRRRSSPSGPAAGASLQQQSNKRARH